MIAPHFDQKAHAETGAPSAGDRGTILIADDQPIMSSIMRHYLESLGYRVHVAPDGREATQMALRLKPDLILMDVHMPLMNGLDATRLLRSSVTPPELRSVPIICLTGLNTQADKERCIEAGASGWLMKPFKIAELNQILRDFVRLENIESC